MLIESTSGWSALVCCRPIGTDSSREPGQGQSVKTGACPGGWVAVASWHATGGVGGTQPDESACSQRPARPAAASVETEPRTDRRIVAEVEKSSFLVRSRFIPKSR
jgi:hypothetical protein